MSSKGDEESANEPRQGVSRLLKNLLSDLSYRDRLGPNEGAYWARTAYINFTRLKIMSAVTLALFVLLFAWDIVLQYQGKWEESIGHEIVTYFHAFLILLLAAAQIFIIRATPENPQSVEVRHKVVFYGLLCLVLFCTNFLAIGDLMTNSSIAAYIGMVFACASIFILSNACGLAIFGVNLMVMVALLLVVSWKTGISMEKQLINTVAYTVVAIVLSRVLFYNSLRDFYNRLMIHKQSIELGRQNELKEEISERKRTEEELLAYQKQLRSMGARLALAEEAERRRLAVDLHDHIGQYLALSKIKLMSVRRFAGPEIQKPLDEVLGMVGAMTTETRTLTLELSPAILFELGLLPALEWLAENIACAQGLTVEFEWPDSRGPGQEFDSIIFRIVRELLINVVKHAQASRVIVAYGSEDGFHRLSVKDDGVGFDVADLENEELKSLRFGLFSVRERLRAIDGQLEIKSGPGKGTTVVFWIPRTPPSRQIPG